MNLVKRNILIIPALTAGILLLFGFAVSSRSGQESAGVLTAPAEERQLSVRVQAVGELDALRATVVSSRLMGEKAKIIWIIDEGNRVKTGDVLVKLDPGPFQERVEVLKEKIRELETKVDAEGQLLAWEKNQVEQEIQAKKYEFENAKIELKKQQKGDGPLELARLEEETFKAKQKYEKFKAYLAELEEYLTKGAIRESDVGDVRKQLQEAGQVFKTAQSTYQSYKNYVFPSEVEKAKSKVAKCKIALEQTQKGGGFRIGKAIASMKMARRELEDAGIKLSRAIADLEHTEIKAPIPGMAVLKEGYRNGENRKPRIGDAITGNQALVYLPDISKMVVKTQVREVDLHKIGQGKKAVVRVDAYPQLKFVGTVSSIGVLGKVQGRSQSREKYFNVDIILDQEEQKLRPGMTARAEILCADRQGVSVPVQALFDEQGKTFCYVQKGDHFEKREVRFGMDDDQYIIIIQGVTVGEKIAIIKPEKRLVNTRPVLLTTDKIQPQTPVSPIELSCLRTPIKHHKFRGSIKRNQPPSPFPVNMEICRLSPGTNP